MVTRRTILKQLGVITGGMLLLPACGHPERPASIALRNISINADQEELLGQVVDAIIPAGKLPGANALNVPQFILKMVDDCQSPENQKIFLTGLADITTQSKKIFDVSFADLSSAQKEELFRELEQQNVKKTNEKEKNPPATFISMAKRYTVQGYLQSEYVMTNVTNYVMIPGRFDGCIPMEKNRQIILG